ncbi:tetratricopeptide repeat-containing sulfotransferase family protein [Dyella sp.]|uniref:tetratricopeptide repeat-containing sulfotransferase family protein n=1 Tax=Dyella sp. TaxID=1869338 RepID=UPI002ED6B0CE
MTDPATLYARLIQAYQQNHLSEAEALCAQLFPLAPNHPGVFGIAGLVHLQTHRPGEAALYLERATTLDPSRTDFAVLYAKALVEAKLTGPAVTAADRALAMAQADAAALDTLGVIYSLSHQPAKAVEAFRQAVAITPGNAPLRYNLGTALITLGDIEGAERELLACIDANPGHWPAYLTLAQLRPVTEQENHLASLQQLSHDHASEATAETYLQLAMGKEHEDLGRYASAFEHYRRGKQARRTQRPYDRRRDVGMVDQLMRTFPLTARTTGHPTREPIFVMGMPRTGTTLIERILSSHPQVQAAGELQNFAAILQRASATTRPLLFTNDLPERAQRLDWTKLGADYLASTRPATGHRSHFIDKLPHNFLYAGFIAHALPMAPIICLRRDPLDTCIANFRQLFDHPSMHFDYSNDLLDIGRYYLLFDRLMAHWERAIPGRVLQVSYERLVAAPEPEIRRILNFCNLPWHDACLHIERNTAPVATLSATQVRSPIHRGGVGRWRHYASQLEELRVLLDQAPINA